MLKIKLFIGTVCMSKTVKNSPPLTAVKLQFSAESDSLAENLNKSGLLNLHVVLDMFPIFMFPFTTDQPESLYKLFYYHFFHTVSLTYEVRMSAQN